MLKIREDQMSALAEISLRKFIADNLEHLRKTAPEQTREMDDGQLSKLAMNASYDALEFSIARAGHLRRYLEAALILGSDFFEDPEHGDLIEILEDHDIGPSEKLSTMDDYIAFRR